MRNFARAAFLAAATATVSLACGTAQAAILVVDVAGAISYGKFGDAKNTVLFFDIGANSHVVASAYSVTIEAFRPSYMSDMMVSFTDSADIDGVDLRPGYNATRSGTGSFSGATTDLVAQKRDFFVGADGLLRLEFSDSWDDIRGSAEGRWLSGTLTFTYDPVIPAVPEPATWAMSISGFSLVGGAMRRRKTPVTVAYA